MRTILSRRDALKAAGVGALSLSMGSLGGRSGRVRAQEPQAGDAPLPYEHAPLPYDYDALEPQISEEILRIHHGRHHAGYVSGLNATLAGLEKARAEEDYSDIRALSRDLSFNCAGHVLHVLYWESMTPGGSPLPGGDFQDAVESNFGSFQGLTAQFAAASVNVEANGWGLLGYEPLGRRLLVLQVENHQKLTTWGLMPLMTCDVWEHAYYLQYQHRRAEYVERFMELVDWAAVAERYEKASA